MRCSRDLMFTNSCVLRTGLLTRKLEAYNIDLIEPGEPQGGEPTYRLRR